MLGFDAISESPISALPDDLAGVARPGRILYLFPDVRTVILYPDEVSMQQPPLEWSPAGADDADWYWLSLSQWIAPLDQASNAAVDVTGPAGDTDVPAASSVAIEAGERVVVIAPGVTYTDPGPRVVMKLTGGTMGSLYTTRISWQTTQGRRIHREVQLFIQW